MSPAFRRLLACAASLLVVLTLAGAAPAKPAPKSAAKPRAGGPATRISAAALLHDIAAISDDSTEGRAPGTPGDRKARGYLVRRLQQ